MRISARDRSFGNVCSATTLENIHATRIRWESLASPKQDVLKIVFCTLGAIHFHASAADREDQHSVRKVALPIRKLGRQRIAGPTARITEHEYERLAFRPQHV